MRRVVYKEENLSFIDNHSHAPTARAPIARKLPTSFFLDEMEQEASEEENFIE